jgi:hypothetical protein
MLPRNPILKVSVTTCLLIWINITILFYLDYTTIPFDYQARFARVVVLLIVVGVVGVVIIVVTCNIFMMATNDPAPKRTRFDATAQIGTETKSPLAIANAHIALHVSSLQTGIATILQSLGQDLLLARKRIFDKSRQITRMESDEDLIPNSAKIDFIPKVSKAMEQSQEYITLRDDSLTVTRAFQKQCKDFIIRALKIDIRSLQNALTREFAKALCLTAIAFLIADGSETLNLQRLANTILDRHHEVLLSGMGVTLQDFRAIYKDVNGLTNLPDPMVQANDLNHGNIAAEYAAALQAHQVAVANHDSIILPPPEPPAPPPANPPQPDAAQQETNRIFRTLESIFVRPWHIYQDSRARNERALALKKLSTEVFTATATENAQTEMDLEVPADRHQLQALIRKQADDANRKLSAQVKKLERQLGTIAMAKNLPRGRNTTGGASSTKRKSPSPSPRKKKTPNARGADASNNGSKDANSGKNKTSGKQKSKRTKNRSNTRSNKQS